MLTQLSVRILDLNLPLLLLDCLLSTFPLSVYALHLLEEGLDVGILVHVWQAWGRSVVDEEVAYVSLFGCGLVFC